MGNKINLTMKQWNI